MDDKRLFLLDGMALVYRAHFALIARPIMTSKGVNTSALYGFTQTVLEILKNQQPTHLAVAFDTEAPTARHAAFPDYKATRQEMPEDLSQALPHVRRMLEALNIPLLTCDGYEADDIIGTLVCQAAAEGFTSFMVTPDKDFGQLVSDRILLYKPGRMGEDVEIMGPEQICARWGISSPRQVIDLLALMGDSSDNIPGVPGVGEKTAAKLIAQFGSLEGLLNRTDELTGKLKENILKNAELARLSYQLATIQCDSPCRVDLEELRVREPDRERLRAMLKEFEFRSLERRLFGKEDTVTEVTAAVPEPEAPAEQGTEYEAPPEPRVVKKLTELTTHYAVAATKPQRTELVQRLLQQKAIGFRLRTSPGGSVLGIAFTWEGFAGTYVPLVGDDRLQDFAAVLESPAIDKVGHDLKGDLLALRRLGLCVRGRMFDAMVAHSLAEPDMRHSIEYLSETLLGLALAPAEPAGGQVEFALLASPLDEGSPTLQRLDASWQLRAILEPLLLERKQERVFYEVESPLIAVLAGMEFEGIRVDAVALGEFAGQLAQEMATKEKLIFSAAGGEFNLNSPRQLGQVLFERLKLGDAPKKTRTGQYATDEQTLLALAGEHEVVQHLLDYRAAAKLKTTYADALPQAVRQDTGRVHTTFNQVATSTGRLNSQNPNLQNIPIRRELGQEVRRAFVPRGPGFALLSADYSQIELRIIAALSREPGLLEAFRTSQDVHTATAARVYGVSPEDVTSEMRRKAKMVNYGIAYGISAFGLAQRLRIPRKEAMEIIDNYFRQFAGIRRYMDDTIAFARKHGYVETVTGRRRYLRDINSRNATVRNAAERNAINMPIQGTAADMIKIAMVRIDRALEERRLNTRMLLQVHDELVFDLDLREEKEVQELVCQLMREAIVLEVPIEVEVGVGRNWLEAH